MTDNWPSPVRPSSVDLALTAAGISLTLSAGVAAIYASGFQLSQPITKVHIVPLGVIVAVVLTVAALAVELRARADGRLAPLVAVAGALGLVVVLLLVLRPTTSLSRPTGAALPWFVVSLTGALLGVVVFLVAALLRRRRGFSTETPLLPIGRLRALLAVALALGLTVGGGVAAQRLSTAYLSAVNEYRESPLVATGPAVRSSLTGGVRWQATFAYEPRVASLSTPYGIVLTETSGVTELDPATGQVRWRYQRSDVAPYDSPEVWAIDGGQRLVVRWSVAFFVLDARTGTRVARWPSTYVADQVEGGDPSLLEHHESSDQTTLTAVDDQGHRQWRYAAKCQFTNGVRMPTIALVHTTDACGSAQQLVGLDPASGRQRWAIDHGPVNYQALTRAVAVITDDTAQPPTSLVGLDPATGQTRWTTALRAGGQACADTQFRTQGSALAVICRTEVAGENPVTWVLRYDVATGRLLDQANLGSQVMRSATVTADGRVVVFAESRQTPSCPLTVVQADGTKTAVSDVPTTSACLDAVHAVGNQVLLINIVTGVIRALR